MSIGQKISQIRKENHLTQQQLSKELHVTRQTISKWENDLSLPDMDMMICICDYFQIPIHQFLGIENHQVDEVTLSDIYTQITAFQDRLISTNKKRQYINLILIILVILSLVLSTFMYMKIKRYDNILDTYRLADNYPVYSEWPINVIDENEVFVNDFSKTYMETVLCDLTNETIELKYHFTLATYHTQTKLSITFETWQHHVLQYDFHKVKDNIFEFHETIPLDNYSTTLTIDNGNGEKKEVSIHSTDYLNYYVCQLIKLYMPVDKNGNQQTNTLIYEPLKRNDMTGQLKKGSLIITLTDEENDMNMSQRIKLDKKQEIEFYDDIPLDKQLCIEIVYHVDDQYDTYSCWLTSNPAYITIPIINKDYIIYECAGNQIYLNVQKDS